MTDLLRITSVSQFHELLGLPAPQHPLISFINEEEGMNMEGMDDALFNVRFTSDMYTVMFKDKVSGSLGYGRSSYDFQEGTLIFGIKIGISNSLAFLVTRTAGSFQSCSANLNDPQ